MVRLASATVCLALCGALGCVSNEPETPALFSVPLSAANASVWDWGGITDPIGTAGPRVAIVGFVVEMATTIEEAPERAPVEIKDEVAARQWRAARFDVCEAPVPDDVVARLANDLYAQTVADLEKRGLSVLPLGEVRRTEAYEKLADRPADQNLVISYAPTGRNPDMVYATQVRAASVQGLRIVRGLAHVRQEERGLRLLEQTQADAVMVFRVRVGLHHGRALVDRGTTVQVMTRHVQTTMRMAAAVVSDETVAPAPALAGGRMVYAVDHDRLASEIRRIYPRLLELSRQRPDQADRPKQKGG